MPSSITVHLIAAARPNFMKVAPLYHELEKAAWCNPVLVHTGQHYDFNMSGAFFTDLGLQDPHHHLNVGSGNHAQQTANVMLAYDEICEAVAPAWTIVVGDVNSTVACALVASKRGIPLAHLEAGLRSFDRTMPEEINRIITDSISDVLWTPSPDGDENLIREGVPKEKIDYVGNIMIDAFERQRDKIEALEMASTLGLDGMDYGVVTLHRPSNVDDSDSLKAIVDDLLAIAEQTHLVFPIHPRTRGNLMDFGLLDRLAESTRVQLIEPMRYNEFLSLVTTAAFIITDSGGIQEETTYLGVPCLTVRENTERPITITQGTNQLAKIGDLPALVTEILSGNRKSGGKLALWDGKTAQRVAESLRQRSALAP